MRKIMIKNKETIEKLIIEGLTITQLMEKTKKSQSSLYYFAKKYGLTIQRDNEYLKISKQKAIDAKEKECISCKETLSIDFFYKQVKKENNNIWYYYDSSCKPCRLEYSTLRRKNIKIKALEYKGWCCFKCGLIDKEFPQIYDFHHIDPRQKDFSISKSNLTFEKIKKELDKCIVLCANCHRKEHVKDFN